ncbi:hypothetical protein MTO96_002635 [Rhipicephalus appendiculatus]
MGPAFSSRMKPYMRIVEAACGTLRRVRVRARNEVIGRRKSPKVALVIRARVKIGRVVRSRGSSSAYRWACLIVSACCCGGRVRPRNPEGPSGALLRRPVGRVPGEGQSDGSCRDKNRCSHLTHPEGHCHKGQLSVSLAGGLASDGVTSPGQTHKNASGKRPRRLRFRGSSARLPDSVKIESPGKVCCSLLTPGEYVRPLMIAFSALVDSKA